MCARATLVPPTPRLRPGHLGPSAQTIHGSTIENVVRLNVPAHYNYYGTDGVSGAGSDHPATSLPIDSAARCTTSSCIWALSR